MNVIVSVLGYGLAAAVFLFLSLVLFVTRQGGVQRHALLIAVVMSLAWSLAILAQLYWHWPMSLVAGVETLRNTAWFALVYVAMSPNIELRHLLQGNRLRQGILIGGVGLGLIQILCGIFDFSLDRLTSLTQITQAVLGLWLIEQLYRRIDDAARHAFKPFCIGLGLIFAYDFAFYADAMLTTGLSFQFWSFRGVVLVLASPLILLSARRINAWKLRVYVSRDVVYHSTLLLVAGGYLLVMALVGYYIRYAGGEWGDLAQQGFFALSILLLVSLFLSESLRRKLKVEIAKHFFANKYEYRQEWINFAAVLEDEQHSPYQVALKAINSPFGCKYACLAVQEQQRFVVKAAYNIKEQDPQIQTCIEALAESALEHQWIVDLDELKRDIGAVPFKVDLIQLSRVYKFSFLVPFESNAGLRGVVLLSPPTSTHQVDWEDRDLMRAISRQLAVYLNLHRSNQALAESQQFDTFNRMSAYLVHDLKNVLAQLTLLSKNAERHRDNPEFIDDAFETVDSAAARLSKVVGHLSNKQKVEQRQDACFKLQQAVEQVIESRSVDSPKPRLVGEAMPEQFLLTDRERFINVLSHLVQNAQDASPSDGTVELSMQRQESSCLVKIRDNGCGMSPEFIEQRLFKPFDTTKGNAGMGIGAYDAKRFVESAGGHLVVDSKLGEGSEFVMHFPLPEPSACQ